MISDTFGMQNDGCEKQFYTLKAINQLDQIMKDLLSTRENCGEEEKLWGEDKRTQGWRREIKRIPEMLQELILTWWDSLVLVDSRKISILSQVFTIINFKSFFCHASWRDWDSLHLCLQHYLFPRGIIVTLAQIDQR